MCKKEIKTEEGLVRKLRKIRDKMNEEMQDMNFEEIKEYLKQMREKKSPQHTM